MKTIKLFLAMLMLSAGTIVMAQPQDDGKHKRNPEQMLEMMWRGVSQKLMLSDAQSEKVKPMYLAYVKEMREAAPKHGRMHGQMDQMDRSEKKDIKAPTESDLKAEMKQMFANERKQLDIQEKYFDKFVKELNARQAKFLVQAGSMRMGGHGMGGGMHKGQFNRGHMSGQRGIQGFRPQMNGKGNKPGARGMRGFGPKMQHQDVQPKTEESKS